MSDLNDLDGWQALGLDRHSLAADPRFADLARRDLRLGPDSPALALGFRPIDLSDVGPRPARAARLTGQAERSERASAIVGSPST